MEDTRECTTEGLERVANQFMFSSFEEYIIDRYYRKKMNLADIQNESAVHPTYIRKFMSRRGLPLRTIDDKRGES